MPIGIPDIFFTAIFYEVNIAHLIEFIKFFIDNYTRWQTVKIVVIR